MGLGDEIMITALAKKNRRTYAIPSTVWDAQGNPRWHPVWENNPNILTPEQYREMYRADSDDMPVCIIRVHSKRKHYIDWTNSTPEHCIFQPWDIEPGEIYFNKEEEFFSKNKYNWILIDPTVKDHLRQNKQWPYWGVLQHMLTHRGIKYDINKPDQNIRYWLSRLARYSAVISHEGGLHHAAAALGIPSVVIFGGFISPDITGYTSDNIRNLTHAKDFCGRISPCNHCAIEMKRITPEEVFAALQDVLKA